MRPLLAPTLFTDGTQDGFRFKIDNVLHVAITKMYPQMAHVTTTSESRIKLKATHDGTPLGNGIPAVTEGLVMVDKRFEMKNMTQCIPVNMRHAAIKHSRDECVLVGFYIGKDNRATIETKLSPLWDFAKSIQDAPWVDPFTGVEYWIDLAMPGDHKAQQQITGEGGGAGMSRYFCCYCACTSANRHHCQHMPLVTTDLKAQWEQQHKEITLKLSYDPRAFFCPRGLNGMRKAEAVAECALRGLSADDGTVPMLKQRVTKWLDYYGVEDTDIETLDAKRAADWLDIRSLPMPSAELGPDRQLRAARATLAAHAALERQAWALQQACANKHPDRHLADVHSLVPCVLHGENRLLEKWLTTLLNDLWTAKGLNPKEKKKRMAAFETYDNGVRE